jgi:hypothetical protein
VKIAVVTPTYRWGGLDVNFASIMAQTVQPDVWIIADDRHDSRHEIVLEKTAHAPFKVEHYLPRPKPEGYFSDISWLYDDMAARALAHDCDLIVSMQDYLWVNPTGIESFAALYEKYGDLTIMTGITSLSHDPYPDEVAVVDGLRGTVRWSRADRYLVA